MIVLAAGGDKRITRLAKLFAFTGNRVYHLAGDPAVPTPEGVKPLDYLFWMQEQPDLLLLPVPFSRDGLTLTQNAGREEIRLTHLLDLCHKDSVICGGMLRDDFLEQCHKRKLAVFDYGKDAYFYEENCRLTALGAVKLLKEADPFFGKGSRVLITGFGGCAKALTKLLLQEGALITAAARNPAQRQQAQLLGAATLNFPLQPQVAPFFNVVVNTVPATVLHREFLQALSTETLLLELASSPGGCQLDTNDQYDFRYIAAPGIPGRFFPEDSANIIFFAVTKFLRERSKTP